MRNVRIEKKDVAGAVILYDSPTETIDNIKTYINQIQKLYVIDNSDKQNSELVSALKTISAVHYCYLDGNRGIAAALNCAVELAAHDKFTVLLTMDDDTRTPVMMVSQMISFWNAYPNPIGILSGVHHSKPDTVAYRILPYTLTSGNMLNLNAYKSIGGFSEDLFIDHVDHEYGLRLNENGYSVVELPAVRLNHQLGYEKNIKIGSLLVKKYGTHSPVRLYYFTRNGIHLVRRYTTIYPRFTYMVISEIVKRYAKAIFLDENRMYRLRMLTRGVRDGWKGRLGPDRKSVV